MSLVGENGTQLTMPVMPAGMGGYGMGGFGGDGWWGILFLIAIMCGGWGGFGGFGGMGGLMGMWPFMFGGFGSGFGGGSASAQGALTREQACIDNNFNNLGRTVEGIASAVNQGFSTVDTRICQQQYETARQIDGVNSNMMAGFNAANVVALQNQNALQSQISGCCCDLRTGQMQTQNAIERGFCQTDYKDQANTTAIIQNAHGDTDRILARLDAMESARKDETIADLRTKLAACGDQTTAQYIINQITGILNPRAVPAYPAASPCGLGNWAPQVLANGYGNGNNCGCNTGCCGSCG